MPARLFASVQPIRGESLMSLIARSAERNSLKKLSSALQGVGRSDLPEFLPFTGLSLADRLARRLSVAPLEIERRMHPTMPSGRRVVEWYGATLPRQLLEARRRRFSAASFRASPHVRATWMVRVLTFCPESFELLTDVCPDCHRTLGWCHTLGPWRCEHCGERLWRSCPGSQSVEPELREVLQIAADLVDPQSAKRERALRRFPTPFREWDPGIVFAATVRLGASAEQDPQRRAALVPIARRRGQFTTLPHQSLSLGLRLALEWPESFLPVADEIADRVAAGTIMREALGDFAWALSPSSCLKTLVLDTVRERLAAAEQRAWRRVEAAHANRNLITQSMGVANARFIGKFVPRLVGRGHCHVGSVIRRGRRRQIFDGDLLARSAEIFRAGITEREAARIIGVPAYCIPALAALDLIGVIDDHDATLMNGGQLYSRDSVECCWAKLAAQCHPQAAPGGTALRHALWGRLAPQYWALAVRGVAAGSIPVTAAGLDDRASALLLDETALNLALAGCPHPTASELEVSRAEAADLLDIGHVLVAKLALSGMLEGRWQRKTLRVTLASISRFQAANITARELERRFDGSRRKIFYSLKAAGLRPIFAAKHGMVWDRAAVEWQASRGVLRAI